MSTTEPDDSESYTIQDDEVLKLQKKLNTLVRRVDSQLVELLGLYRRLHIELNDAGRSGLIVDLFEDTRTPVRLLGFELVDRDLSSSTVLDPLVGDSARVMLGDEDAQIRALAASLITRLVLPDAMLILTESLRREDDPIAAEAMLVGIARWPSPEVTELVLRWMSRSDSPFGAACDAAWSLEEAGLWDSQEQHPLLVEKLRGIAPQSLNEAGMKLFARFGSASDLQMLVSLLLADNLNQQRWAANALVETPRAVELLVQAAEQNSKLFLAAADSLIHHRATPEGLRRLASLPSSDSETRTDALIRMGSALDNDRLTEAVRLAGLDTTESALLLSRLLNTNEPITPRVAKGVILLAEIELSSERPNRALEAALALDGITLDQSDRDKIDSIKATSLILLGKTEEASSLDQGLELWLGALELAQDQDLRKKIASHIIHEFSEAITEELDAELRLLAGIEIPADEQISLPETVAD